MTKPTQPLSDDDRALILTPNTYVVSRTLGAQTLILDPTRDEIRQLNEVGTFIWSMILKSEYTKDDVLNAIIETFETPSDVALADLEEFLNELDSVSLIRMS